MGAIEDVEKVQKGLLILLLDYRIKKIGPSEHAWP